MRFYSFVLFVHVTAVLALVGAVTFEALSLFHLRRASTLTEVRFWLDLVPKLPLATVASLLILFFSGIYLTIRMSAFGEAWPRVSIAALLFVAPIAAITGRRMRAIRRTCATVTATNSALRGRLRDPALKASLAIRLPAVFATSLPQAPNPTLSH